MKPAIVTAWLFGMGLITYRFVVKQHQPPIPGNMLAASGTFGLLALLAEYQPAAGAAAAIAWGLDLAALLGLFPESVAGPQGSGTPSPGLTGLQKIAQQQAAARQSPQPPRPVRGAA